MKTRNKILTISVILLMLAIFTSGLASTVSAQDDEPLEMGAQVYFENCAVCHGFDGQGRVGATLAKDFPSIRPELTTRSAIANGVAGSAMPAWSRENGGPLTDEEIDAVVNYVLSWQTGGAPENTPLPTATARPEIEPLPDVQGNPNQGAVLYDYNCAVCHGSDGTGRIGATLTKNWGAIRTDLAIRSTIANGGKSSLMPAWSQENGGPLSDNEVDDIVSFVLSLSSDEGVPIPTPTIEEPSPWVGSSGVILTLFLFALFVIVILLIQIRRRE